jgi:hypothetical protein
VTPVSMIRNLIWMLLAATLGGPLASAQPADVPKTESPKIVEVRLGFDNIYKLGCWTPVEVDLVGGTQPYTGRLMITVPDSDGVPATVVSPTERPVGVQPGQLTTARMFVRVGRSMSSLRVRFLAEGKVRSERTFHAGSEPGGRYIAGGIPATNRLLLQFGPALGLGELVRGSQSQNEHTMTRVARLEDAAALPTRWFGYEGVDTVLLSTSQVELYRPLLQNPARVVALRQWVEGGGRLVIFCGREAEELLGEGGVLEELVPGDFERMVPLRQSLPLEAFSGSNEAITPDRRLDLRVPKLINVLGTVLAHAGREQTDLPLVIRWRLGFGEVVFLGLDFDRPPLRDWDGRTAFLRRALSWTDEEKADKQTQTYAGVETQDMTEKLRSALDSKFAGVTTVPFALVAILVIGYILLIGPGDYFFVKKILRRMELTWITFPLIVVGVSAGAFWLAHWMKGDQLRVNQVEIVDVDIANNRVRGTVWTHFFTPRVDEYNLSIQPHYPGDQPLEESSQLVSWLGLPGYAPGGMQASGTQGSMLDRGFTFNDSLSAMDGVPVQLWSTKTITARWEAEVAAPMQSELLHVGEEMLRGHIVNDSQVPLEDCMLLYGPWAYRLGRLAPDQTLQIDDELQPRTVKTMLTSATAGDTTEARTAEDGTVGFREAQTDVARLVKAMMFFDAIDGGRYTGILNRYQASVDLSSLLQQQDQAILLARCSEGGSQWLDGDKPLRSDQDRRWTYYRFLLPVATGLGDESARSSN